MRVLKHFKMNAVVMAVILCLMGLVFVLAPGSTSIAICYVLAAGMGITAITYYIRFIRECHDGIGLGNGLGIGIMLTIATLFAILEANRIATMIPIIFGFFVVFSGSIKIQNSCYLWRVHCKNWWGILILAMVNLAVGVVLLWNPMFQDSTKLMIAIGVALLFSGISDLVVTIIIIKQEKNRVLLEEKTTD